MFSAYGLCEKGADDPEKTTVYEKWKTSSYK